MVVWSQIQNIALYELLWKTLTLSQPKPLWYTRSWQTIKQNIVVFPPPPATPDHRTEEVGNSSVYCPVQAPAQTKVSSRGLKGRSHWVLSISQKRSSKASLLWSWTTLTIESITESPVVQLVPAAVAQIHSSGLWSLCQHRWPELLLKHSVNIKGHLLLTCNCLHFMQEETCLSNMTLLLLKEFSTTSAFTLLCQVGYFD